MIDAKAVVDQVQQGNPPPNWRIYRGTSGCRSSILCLSFFIIGIILTLVGFTHYNDINNPTSGYSPLLLVLAISFGPAFLLVMPFGMLRYGYRVLVWRPSFMVILPDGVVEYHHVRKKYFTLTFALVSNIQLAQHTGVGSGYRYVYTYTTYWLDVFYKDGTYSQWPIPQRFRGERFLSQTIIGAFNAYKYGTA